MIDLNTKCLFQSRNSNFPWIDGRVCTVIGYDDKITLPYLVVFQFGSPVYAIATEDELTPV